MSSSGRKNKPNLMRMSLLCDRLPTRQLYTLLHIISIDSRILQFPPYICIFITLCNIALTFMSTEQSHIARETLLTGNEMHVFNIAILTGKHDYHKPSLHWANTFFLSLVTTHRSSRLSGDGGKWLTCHLVVRCV